MRNITIGDMDIGLENLFGKRNADLQVSAAGKLYGPMLAKKHSAIKSLPESLRKRPLVAELDVADAGHDGYGGAIFAYVESIFVVPGITDATRAAARRIQQAFIPNKSALTDSYAEEAAAAKRNRLKLAERENDLKLFPVAEGKTLYDWVVAFLDAGDQLDVLLDERSLVGVGGKENAGKLRSETLGLLYQFRTTLKTEIANDEALPRDLEGKVFSYFDELSARRKSPKSKTTEGAGGAGTDGG